MQKIYFGGSRNLAPSPILAQVVGAVVKSGAAVHVGCQFGADQQVIQAAGLQPRPFNTPSSFLFVFAVAPNAAEAPRHVQWSLTRSVSVKFSAGGNTAPIPARYLLRSIAAFQGCNQAVFFSPGSGSLAVARECVRSGLPVFAFQQEPPARVPSVLGQWVASSFIGFSCWQWQSPKQPTLF